MDSHQKVFGLLAATAAALPAAGSTGDGNRPNVIVFITDDQGFADVGYHGYPASAEVLTPNIDRLAASGIAFKNGYVASATCGPSRASLLTGRTSSRFGMEDNNNMPGLVTGPPLDEIIIPRILREHGYVSGAFGKWHLGEIDGMTPEDRGFDYYWGGSGGSGDYFFNRTEQPPVWDPPRDPLEAYMTDATTDEALAFIRRHHDQPFFAYIGYNAPHSPFQTQRRLLERVVEQRPMWTAAYERMLEETGKWHGDNYNFGRFKGLDLDQDILRLVYISMLLSVDDGVGEILDLLEEKGLRENTLVYFLSDNGAALSRPNDLGGVNLPLRHGKGSVFEGGVRVPFILSWPGTLEPRLDEETIVSAMDIFTTTVELAGGEIPRDRVIDGVNHIPYLTGEKQGQPHDILFFRRLDRQRFALRSGNYKWVNMQRAGDMLFDLSEDIGERNNLSDQHPEMTETLRRTFEELTRNLPDPEHYPAGR